MPARRANGDVLVNYIIEIPGCEPPSLNTWLSKPWRQRWNTKQGLEWMVLAYARQQDLPLPIQTRVDVWVTVYNRAKTIDADNVPVKGFVDGLRYAGVLRDDDRQCVRWSGSSCEEDAGEPRVVIEIEEIVT